MSFTIPATPIRSRRNNNVPDAPYRESRFIELTDLNTISMSLFDDIPNTPVSNREIQIPDAPYRENRHLK